MEKGINKVVEIVKETGEHVVFLSSDGETALVVMRLEEFQFLKKSPVQGKDHLTDLTEEQFLNRINREISDWKSAQLGPDSAAPVVEELSSELSFEAVKMPLNRPDSSQGTKPGQKDETFYFEPVDDSRQ